MIGDLIAQAEAIFDIYTALNGTLMLTASAWMLDWIACPRLSST